MYFLFPNLTKFRPILLAQCLLKVLERMINNRIYKWLDRNHKLPNSQSGFRNKRSCLNNLLILTSDTLCKWHDDMNTGTIFLDIKGAYDNILNDILIGKLLKLGIQKSFVKFIHNLISDREVHFCFNEIDEIRSVNRGLPQGCVLSPILYSIYVSDLEDFLKKESPSIKVLQFADNICLYVSHRQTFVSMDVLESTESTELDSSLVR